MSLKTIRKKKKKNAELERFEELFQDIYIIAVPALGDQYDPEIEKRLMRAAKKKILEDLDEDYFLGYGI